MKKFTLYSILYLVPFACFSQQVQPLDKGFNLPVRALYADTVENTVYAGGDFTTGGSGNPYTYPIVIVRWNGITWDSIFKPKGSFIADIIKFQNKLFVGGNGCYLYVYDGSNWDSVKVGDNSIYNCGTIWGLYNYNNEALYALGAFDSMGGLAANMIAKYDGTNWYNFPELISDDWAISTAMMYKDKLYVGGNFSTSDPSIKDIARFNFATNQWETVGGGTTCDCIVEKLYIWRDTLIVAGYFQSLGGQPFNNVAAWDGDNWLPLGNGLTPSNVWDFAEYDNHLYACGQILMGQIVGVAKWDGQQWTGTGLNFAGAGVVSTSLAVLNNSLYIGGGFITINGDTMNRIAKYTLPVGIEESSNSDFQFHISPNPGSGKFTLQIMNDELRMKNFEVKIYNILGEFVFKSQIPNPKSQIQIDLSAQPSGIYFYQINTEKKTYSGKMVKE